MIEEALSNGARERITRLGLAPLFEELREILSGLRGRCPEARREVPRVLDQGPDRRAHMQTRISHFNLEVHVGMSVPDAIQAVASQRPR